MSDFVDHITSLNIILDPEWEIKFHTLGKRIRMHGRHKCPSIWGATKEELLHRIVANARDGEIVDHINGDQSDCRGCNLRIVSTHQSAWNTKVSMRNRTGVKGVSFDRLSARWVAEIQCRGTCHRKKFKDIDRAVAWRRSKEAALHGRHARK